MNRSVGLLLAGALAVPACGQAKLEAPYAGRSRPFLRPVVSAPPTVAEPGRPLSLEVYVGSGVTGAELVWTRKGDARREARAMRRAAARKFAYEVPAADLVPGRYEYAVRATEPGGTVESVTYSLFVSGTQVLEPVLRPMARSTFLTSVWGEWWGALGREVGEEAATTVPSAVVGIGPDEIAVADTANSRVVFLARGGVQLREVFLPGAQIEHLAYEPVTASLLALDAYHEDVWEIRPTEVAKHDISLGVGAEEVVDLVIGPVSDPENAPDTVRGQVNAVLYAIVEPQLNASPVMERVDNTWQRIRVDWDSVPGIPADFGAYAATIDRVLNGVNVQMYDPLFEPGDPAALLGTFRVPFSDRILDVTPVGAEPSGVVALLVGTLGEDGAVHDQLLYVNTTSPAASIAMVTEPEPGDMKRRIATTSRGVVIFTEENGVPTFVEYTAEGVA